MCGVWAAEIFFAGIHIDGQSVSGRHREWGVEEGIELTAFS
jgi:hypothetical protein